MSSKKNYRPEILKRDNEQCRACGTGRWPLHVHHITFRSHGGPDEPWNLVTLCESCHNKAHGLVKGHKIAKWELHACVYLGWHLVSLRQSLNRPDYRRMITGEAVYDPGRICLTCQHRARDGCEIWEHPVDWDFWCDAWVVRVLD